MQDHIVVAVDGSLSSVRQLELAAHHAHAVGARLTIVHPFTDGEVAGPQIGTSRRDAASALANAAAEHARGVVDGDLRVDARALRGTMAVVLTGLLDELGPGVTVLGNHAVQQALRTGASRPRRTQRLAGAVGRRHGLEQERPTVATRPSGGVGATGLEPLTSAG